MGSSAPGAMTKRPRVAQPTRVAVAIGPIPPEQLDACARVVARLAVEKAPQELGLDTGRTFGDNGPNQHKEAPPGVSAPNGAKERVL